MIVCSICKRSVRESEVAKNSDGTDRLDIAGKKWCTNCAKYHDSIDWDKEVE